MRRPTLPAIAFMGLLAVSASSQEGFKGEWMVGWTTNSFG